MAKKRDAQDMARFTIRFTPEQRQRLEDYRFKHRYNTRTAAILALLAPAIGTDQPAEGGDGAEGGQPFGGEGS